MSVRAWLFVPGLISAVFAVGCGGGSSGPIEPLVPVGGTLLIDGQPLDGVVVTFIPDIADKERQGGSGTTDGSGAFTIKHLGQNLPGLAVGKYTVACSRMRLSDGSAAPEVKSGSQPDPANIRIESLPVNLTNPNPKDPATQVVIPKDGNLKLELKLSKKK